VSAYTYDIGDPTWIVFQLIDPATGQAADATTATSQVVDPDGITTTPVPAHQGAAGSGQYALSFTVGKAGVWRGKGIFTGTVAQTIPFVLVVAADSALLAWSPTLTQVADYVPARTRPGTPGAGDDTLTGTFTASTRPTGEQVTRLAAAAAAHVSGTVGTVDPTLYSLATAAAAQRAAAYVEYAYPERSADLDTGDKLLALADATLTRLQAANVAITGVPIGAVLLPVWSMPAPTTYGDLSL
jgi:hypothetical protein